MDEVILVPYDPSWPERFSQEAALLRSVLPAALPTRIEHFGSTAVAGLQAKPIIDILLGVTSVDEARENAVPILETLGYSYWSADPRRDRLFLVKGLPPNGPRSHHLHIVEPGSADWERLLFRDYLRANPDEAQRYAALKHEWADLYFGDREAYTDAKTEYVRYVTELARGP